MTRPLHLDVVRRPRNSSVISYDKDKYGETFLEDEISSFEYRLHPKEHRGKIRQARIMSKLQQHQMEVIAIQGYGEEEERCMLSAPQILSGSVSNSDSDNEARPTPLDLSTNWKRFKSKGFVYRRVMGRFKRGRNNRNNDSVA